MIPLLMSSFRSTASTLDPGSTSHTPEDPRGRVKVHWVAAPSASMRVRLRVNARQVAGTRGTSRQVASIYLCPMTSRVAPIAAHPGLQSKMVGCTAGFPRTEHVRNRVRANWQQQHGRRQVAQIRRQHFLLYAAAVCEAREHTSSLNLQRPPRPRCAKWALEHQQSSTLYPMPSYITGGT
ncbi:hypothetical protein L227DRAFT_354061 [Lentinus tigrinus ALCF2SS1-6]|uniref:Uncharacterized protein n=1 Tax=Lentinus tigrinus ALCF2SS1-6 TaxID=1328759 RepID=A0A5C2RUW8_9APHY|nr:hypothetical protein L227DRAFT_354061 [Lentinus tigrinus ALCF2SS1-6]